MMHGGAELRAATQPASNSTPEVEVVPGQVHPTGDGCQP